MKKILAIIGAMLFIASFSFAGTRHFTDTANRQDNVIIGGASDVQTNYLTGYGGGSDAVTGSGGAVANVDTKHPFALRMYTGGDSPTLVYLWIAIINGEPTLMISSGATATGYGYPGESGFDNEASGTIVGSQSN